MNIVRINRLRWKAILVLVLSVSFTASARGEENGLAIWNKTGREVVILYWQALTTTPTPCLEDIKHKGSIAVVPADEKKFWAYTKTLPARAAPVLFVVMLTSKHCPEIKRLTLLPMNPGQLPQNAGAQYTIDYDETETIVNLYQGR